MARADDTYRIVHIYPHDPRAFTQGLVFVDGHLYESTGINGQSTLRMVDLETGRILQYQPVDAKYFAEGLTDWGSTLVQLTWQSHLALVYDRFTFRLLRTFSYHGEGWGLTQDPQVPDPERRDADPPLLRSPDVQRGAPPGRNRPRQAGHGHQRT